MQKIYEYILGKYKIKATDAFYIDMTYEEAIKNFKGYTIKEFANVIERGAKIPNENEIFCVKWYGNSRKIIMFKVKQKIYSIIFDENKGIVNINKCIEGTNHKTMHANDKATILKFLKELNRYF